MARIDPKEAFTGKVVVAAPHMDDEVLACGMTIASLAEKEQVYVVYATDGSKSPVPILPWIGKPSPDLVAIRKQEALTAMQLLTVPQGNVRFLGFPDGELRDHIVSLTSSLIDLVYTLTPDYLFIPFRFDRHPDHLALHQAARQALSQEEQKPTLVEYFVYNRWQLLPGKDVRKFIPTDRLMEVNVQKFSDLKKKALLCYKSQTTLFLPWQDRPILTPERVEEVSRSPEFFLKYEPELSGSTIFSRLGTWIRFVHRFEPLIKLNKERILALRRLGPVWNGRKTV